MVEEIKLEVPSEAKIKKFLKRVIFGKRLFCPVCRSYRILRYGKRYRCRRCRSKFSLTSHTWLSNMKISYRKFWEVLYCWVKQIPIRQSKDITKLSEKAVRHYYSLFRRNLPYRKKELLEAIVQLDEAYFGSFQSRALFLAKQKGKRKIAYRLLPKGHIPTKYDAVEFIKENVRPGSVVCTDGSLLYYGIEKYVPVIHKVEYHNKNNYSLTAEIEGLIGVLRTFIRRVYHHVSLEHLDEILCEFSARFCTPEIFDSPQSYLANSLTLVPTG